MATKNLLSRKRRIAQLLFELNGMEPTSEEIDQYYKAEMRAIARLGGKAKTHKPKGFAVMDKKRLSEIGRKGGTISRRSGVKNATKH